MIINRLSEGKCTGCLACYNACHENCIVLQTDLEGFVYPSIDKNKCINCGRCEEVCPILNLDRKIDQNADTPELYAAYNKNEHVRLLSSSGGIFTLIANYILQKNGVVFGACFDEEFNVHHSYINSKDDIHIFRGSKYVQSHIGYCYRTLRAFLKAGKWVLFSGTSCQVSGLKNFLRNSYDKLICVDFVCRGVPSPAIWEKYKKWQETKYNQKIKQIEFKNKDSSWKRFSMKITFQDGSIYLKTLLEDSYFRAFLTSKVLRPSCYQCEYKGIYRNSDITLADSWGADILYPDLFDDKGLSYIMLNSKKGKQIFNAIEPDIKYIKTAIDNLTFCSTNSVKSVDCPGDRTEVFNHLKVEYEILANKYFPPDTIKMVCRKDPFYYESERIKYSKNICAFGAGRTFKNYISNSPYKIKYVCDNDTNKWGRTICGIRCIEPQELLNIQGVFVIITIDYYDIAKQIHKQLIDLKIPHKLFLQ